MCRVADIHTRFSAGLLFLLYRSFKQVKKKLYRPCTSSIILSKSSCNFQGLDLVKIVFHSGDFLLAKLPMLQCLYITAYDSKYVIH